MSNRKILKAKCPECKHEFLLEKICMQCSHKWTPKEQTPKKCPKCQRTDYDVNCRSMCINSHSQACDSCNNHEKFEVKEK